MLQHRRKLMANNVGSALSSLLTTGVTFAAPLTTSIVPQTGTGSATYTRATVATVFDNESVLRNVLSGEARFQGARRVANQFTATTTLSTQNVTTIAGTYTVSFKGTGTITFSGTYVGSLVGQGANVRVSATFTATAGTLTNTVSGTVTEGQCENVTGQSNQAPAEYVSVGVLSTPFHGAGVDGVKYFSTTNGNSVASNVVTESAGSPISASTLLGYLAEGAGTQLVTPTASIRDMTNAAWVKGATMTAALTGTGIDGVANSCTRLTGGAAAGTNTAFQTLVAAATSRTYSCYIKRVTGTGVINITQNGGTGYTDITSQINSSTFTRVSLNASVLNAAFGIQIVTNGDVILVDFNQFESGAFATSPMASAGAARNADVLTYPSAGNISGTVGSAYVEVATGDSVTGPAGVVATTYPSGAPLYISSANTLLYDGATQIVASPAQTVAVNSSYKLASSWGGVEAKFAKNGGASSGSVAFDGNLNVGADVRIGFWDTTQYFYGTIRNVRIYSAQLSAAQLSAMTA